MALVVPVSEDHAVPGSGAWNGPYPATDAGFTAFFRENYLALKRAVYLMCGRPEDAADVVQEAMGRVYERWGKVSQMTTPAGYAFAVARNELRRRIKRDRCLVLAGTVRLTVSASDPLAEVLAKVNVRHALSQLSPSRREALVLIDYLRFTPAEAAQIVGASSGAMRVRLHRAREQFRELIEAQDG